MHKNVYTCIFSPNSLFLVADLLRREFIIFLSPILRQVSGIKKTQKERFIFYFLEFKNLLLGG